MREIETRAAIIMAARRRAARTEEVRSIIEHDALVRRTPQETAERIVKHMERYYGSN